MSNTIQHYIANATERKDLTDQEAEHAFQIIMNGGATPAQMAAFLVALAMKGESVVELQAGARVLRAKAHPFKSVPGALDSCGTGGDAKGSLNISTAVAIVVAACGVPVAKHGNRSVSSRSGSSDVLKELGVVMDAPYEALEEALTLCNLTFLAAPRFHTTMRHVAPVRQELGIRTIFNLLGPLANPAHPDFQVVGVYASRWLKPVAETLKILGVKAAWVVHGSDGMDELTTTGTSEVVELKDSTFREFTFNPADYGIAQAKPDDLTGGNAEYNAHRIRLLLSGTKDAYRDIVLINAAAALLVSGKVLSIEEGLTLAAKAIDSGKAKETLATLVALLSDYKNMAPLVRKSLDE